MLKDFHDVAEQEVEILKLTDTHENIVRLYFMSKNANFVHVVLELCLGYLSEFVEQHYMYNELNIMRQITNGLAFLHSHNIIHRDLKPMNILYQDVNSEYVFKLTDFGLGRQLNELQTSYTTITSGTKGWRAPELINGSNKLTNKADIFALGCIYYYIASHSKHPFGSVIEREVNITKNKVVMDLNDYLNENLALEAQYLINNMINRAYKDRPSCNDILQHPLYWTENKS